MTPFHHRDREDRFDDTCKLAAALVVLGMVVFAGEAAMRTVPDLPPLTPSLSVVDEPLEPAHDAPPADTAAAAAGRDSDTF